MSVRQLVVVRKEVSWGIAITSTEQDTCARDCRIADTMGMVSLMLLSLAVFNATNLIKLVTVLHST